jgi:hypothetical protein
MTRRTPLIRETCCGVVAFILIVGANATAQRTAADAAPQRQEPFTTTFTPPPRVTAQQIRDIALIAAALMEYSAEETHADRAAVMEAFAGVIQRNGGASHLLNADIWPMIHRERAAYLLGTLAPPEQLTPWERTAYGVAYQIVMRTGSFRGAFRFAHRRSTLPPGAKAIKYIGQNYVFYQM